MRGTGGQMMKYKVGDRVKVRKDLELGKAYGSNAFCNTLTLNMLPVLGEVVTIQSCYNDAYGIEGYIFLLSDEMIEGLAEEAQTEEPVKLYTWQDLCDYEILLHEKWRIANEQRNEQGQELSVMHTLRQEYMEAIKRAMDKLGRDAPASKAKELGLTV